MAQQTFTIESSLAQTAAFERLSDLTRVNEWDRGVRNALQIGGDRPGRGARYEVTVMGFDGQPTAIVYELTEFESPNRFVMIGENDVFRAHDTLTLTASESGSSLTYVGTLTLLEQDPPLTETQLDAAFKKVAAVAESGLTDFLNP